MKKLSLLLILSLLVLAANYIYTIVTNKFAHSTPLGPKKAITNCNVKANLQGQLTNETIEMHTVDHNMKIIEAVLYGIPYNYTKKYIDINLEILDILKYYFGDVEHLLHLLFSKYNIPITEVKNLDIYGCMAGTSLFRIL
jgi:hypothetical protein